MEQCMHPKRRKNKNTGPAGPVFYRVSKQPRRVRRCSGEENETILCRGVYLAQNTAQAASVEFVRSSGQIMRAADCKNWRKSPKGFFDKIKNTGPAGPVF